MSTFCNIVAHLSSGILLSCFENCCILTNKIGVKAQKCKSPFNVS